MATEEYTELVNALLRSRDIKKASLENFGVPNPTSIRTLLAERDWQRKCIFWFSIGWASVSLLLLIILVSVQVYGRLFVGLDFTIFDGSELQILVVSVFGQILGIIYLIASKVWDNKDYLHFYKD